jgi:NADH-quinone oxidoreductase subunit L
VNSELHKALEVLREEFHGPLQMASHGLLSAPFWLALSGVACAYYMYMINPALPAAINAALHRSTNCLTTSTTWTGLTKTCLLRGARGLGIVLWKAGDQALIDGACVNGSWRVVGWVSTVIRKIQTGYLYDYALTMVLGVFVLMTYFVWLK